MCFANHIELTAVHCLIRSLTLSLHFKNHVEKNNSIKSMHVSCGLHWAVNKMYYAIKDLNSVDNKMFCAIKDLNYCKLPGQTAHNLNNLQVTHWLFSF